ncbi:uncharacterized protein METZ01_LOCUS11789 [marine metagenome]|uniref:Uncharacterized protein n=1 Tax=marine metagenome TaxID=408172 RepID=A0A381NWD9_9ZZZZ|tara:strand:- start:132 stop:263 length:132 start_codon:yes stop_codon:yes gene_type:complete
MQQVVNNKTERIKHVTSIGHSVRSKPKNKHKRRSWKRYKGQGK